MVAKKEKPLSVREIRFCRNYAEHGNAALAYRQLGGAGGVESSWVAASRLLRKCKVRRFIRELQQAAAEAAQVEMNTLAAQLRRMGLADRRGLFDERGCILPPHLWPDDVAAAVESIESVEIFEKVPNENGRGTRKQLVGYIRKIRTSRRIDGLKTLAEWLGMIGTGKDIRIIADKIAAHEPLIVELEAEREAADELVPKSPASSIMPMRLSMSSKPAG